MVNKLNRVRKLEENLGLDDYGLRVVVPIGCFYSDDAEPFRTDEAVKSMVAALDDEPYRKAVHTDGKKDVRGSVT